MNDPEPYCRHGHYEEHDKLPACINDPADAHLFEEEDNEPETLPAIGSSADGRD